MRHYHTLPLHILLLQPLKSILIWRLLQGHLPKAVVEVLRLRMRHVGIMEDEFVGFHLAMIDRPD